MCSGYSLTADPSLDRVLTLERDEKAIRKAVLKVSHFKVNKLLLPRTVATN